MADYQITTENMGKQVARAAAALLALREFDEKMAEFIDAGEPSTLTTAQRKKLEAAVKHHDDIIDASMNIRDQFLTLLATN